MVKLSIVIPYYKTYDLTIKLLDTLIPQLSEEVEVYLIDDGCGETRLDKYKDIINIIHCEKNGGGATACNIGIKKAKGKYIAIVDSDDNVAPIYIKTLLDTIDKHNEDVIYFDWYDINTKTEVKHPQNYAPWKAIYKKEIMPLFIDGWIYSYDVPFQEELSRIEHTEYFIDKILYYYNSNREGSLTIEKEKIRRNKMIKCEVIEKFNLKDFGKLKNIERVGINKEGTLFVGDTFECDEEMAKYLTGDNALKKVVVKVIEVKQPKIKDAVFEEKQDVEKEEPKPKKTTKSKK